MLILISCQLLRLNVNKLMYEDNEREAQPNQSTRKILKVPELLFLQCIFNITKILRRRKIKNRKPEKSKAILYCAPHSYEKCKFTEFGPTLVVTKTTLSKKSVVLCYPSRAMN